MGCAGRQSTPALPCRRSIGHARQVPCRGPRTAFDASQCPGTARSSTSAGRGLIMTSALTCPAARCRARARGTSSARLSSQARQQLSTQSATPLDIQRAVDGLMRDPHGSIIREIDRQPVSDLLRIPGRGPSPVLATPLPLRSRRPRYWRAVVQANHSGKPIGHVLVQLYVDRQFGRLGPARHQVESATRRARLTSCRDIDFCVSRLGADC